jgi:hypothetical protein
MVTSFLTPRAHGVQLAGGIELASPGRAVEGVLQVGCAKLAEQRDDPVSAEIRGIGHRRPTAASLGSVRHLVEQRRMLPYQRTNGVHIITPDGVDHTACEHEARPAGDAVASGQGELRIGELGVPRLDRFRVILPQLHDCGKIAVPDLAEQILRLVLELIEIGTDRQMTIGHDEPPSELPGVCWRRAKRRFVRTMIVSRSTRWTRSFPRTGGGRYAWEQNSVRWAGGQEVWLSLFLFGTGVARQGSARPANRVPVIFTKSHAVGRKDTNKEVSPVHLP